MVGRHAALQQDVLRDDRPSSIASVRPLGDEAHSVIAETRSLLRRRAIYLAGALAFTGLPLLALAYRLVKNRRPARRASWFEQVVGRAAVGKLSGHRLRPIHRRRREHEHSPQEGEAVSRMRPQLSGRVPA